MTMKSLGLILLFLLRAWILVADANKGPPRLLGPSAQQQTVREGDDVKLVCPVDANPPPMVHWTKDGESVTKIWDRLKLNGRSLRLKESTHEDSGLYMCKGVNGFGWEEASIRLLVLGSSSDSQEPQDQSSHRLHRPSWSVVNDDGQGDDEEAKEGRTAIPSLTRATLSQSPFVQRPLGSSFNLLCQAVGNPRPQTTWLKDGQPVDASQVSNNVRDGTVLLMRNLSPRDAGVYTCRAWNIVGEANFDISVEAVVTTGRKPQLEGVHPVNTTVHEGQTASLQCTVRSASHPHIDWLKQVEEGSVTSSSNQSTLDIGGVRFRVLRRGAENIHQTSDGLFLHRLIIPRATPAQSGKYICVGANNQGYSFREAYLTVIPYTVGRNPGDTFSLIPLVALPAVILVLGVFILAAVRWQMNRNKMTASAAPTSPVPVVEGPSREIQMAWSPGGAGHDPNHHQKAPLLLARNDPHCSATHLPRASSGSSHGRSSVGHHHHHYHHPHQGGPEPLLPPWARPRDQGQYHTDLMC